MWEFAAEYALFLAKAVTVVVSILLLAAGVMAAGSHFRPREEGHIQVRKLNDRLRNMRDLMREASLDPKELKQQRKREQKEEKLRKKSTSLARTPETATDPGQRPGTVYVIDFHGDIRAQAVSTLREEVTAILSHAGASDTVVVRIESSGGLVHAYGLAAAQLARFREHGIGLTVCVDKVAASGGYLMACVAQRIVAAPFAMLGSIGVVAQIPNFNRLLRKHEIDYELFTAGQYKRTLTLFGRNTDAGRQKFAEEIEDTHALFKEYVSRFRPQIDIQAVATGEVWFGERAQAKGLIDELGTSDEYLQRLAADSPLLEVRYVERKPFMERLGVSVESAIERGIRRALERSNTPEEWFR